MKNSDLVQLNDIVQVIRKCGTVHYGVVLQNADGFTIIYEDSGFDFLGIVDGAPHYESVNVRRPKLFCTPKAARVFWDGAKSILPQQTELTMNEIAEKFGIDVKNLKIKK